jgi:hypothetical protein
MKLEDTMIRSAGVMRCCITSIQEGDQEKEIALGDKTECKYCKQKFTLVEKPDVPLPIWMPDWQLK